MKNSSTLKKSASNSAVKKVTPPKPAKKIVKSAPDTSKPAKKVKEDADEFEEFRIDETDFGESHSHSGYDDEDDDSY